jgi:hypothetical protein
VASTRLGEFIVHLWRAQLLPDTCVWDCFGVLHTTFRSHEHAWLLQSMISEVGPDFWYRMPDGVKKLQQIATTLDGAHHRIRGNASVLGHSKSDKEAKKQLEAISEMCRKWVDAYPSLQETNMQELQGQYQVTEPVPTFVPGALYHQGREMINGPPPIFWR